MRSILPSARTLLAVFMAGSITFLAGPARPQTASDSATLSRAGVGQVLKATLTNGLRVVIVRNTLAPVVATAMNYLVGSDEAPDGFPGMAHAQEHMMFRGSAGLTADQLANIASLMGGNFNADTRESLTQYLFTVPAEDLDVALNIEAVRMRDVSDAQTDWDKERGAIEQEVAQDLSNPFYLLYENLRTKMFAGTSYAHDALGTKPSFDKTTAAMLKSFHDRWYAPNNAILVIVGDLDLQTTLAKVKTLFGEIPPKKLPPLPGFPIQPLTRESFSLPTDQPSQTQVVAMRMPGLDSPDFPAAELLSDILGSQRFDLYGLVAQGKAVAAQFSLDPLPRMGMGYAALSFPAAGDAKAMDAAIRTILAGVARTGVSPELLAAAKRQEHRQTEFQKNSIADLASVWSDAVALYGLPSPEADLTRLDWVTVADVNRVARKYLGDDYEISATMLPRSSGRPVNGGGFGGQESIALGEAGTTELPVWAQASLRRLSVPDTTLRPVVSKLANGLTLIVQPETVSDTVTVFGHIRNQPEMEEAPGKEGADLILGQLLSYGTEHLDRLGFQRALDDIGANESAGTDFSMRVLGENFERGVELLADNELHPALPETAFASLKNQIGQLVAARNVSPAYLTLHSLRTALHLPGDPSTREATSQSVSRLGGKDVRDYYDRAFRPDLTTIVVVGRISPEQANQVIEKYFGDWKVQGPPPQTDWPVEPSNHAAVIAVPDESRVQDSVVLAQTLALTRSDPDYYPLELGNAVLGGSFYAARLSVDLRKNAGLVYSVNSGLQPGRTRSAYLIRYASDPENVFKAADAVAREIRAMQTSPVGLEELDQAKALLLRQMPLGESSMDQIARALANRVEFGLPLNEPDIAARHYIALTPEQVQAAFQKWMRPQDIVRTSQGPAPR
jgi:zinc protease